MPRISTSTTILLCENGYLTGNYDAYFRFASGAMPNPPPTPTPGAPATPAPALVFPPNRSIEVDGLPQTIRFTDNYWGGRESHIYKYQRMMESNVFLLTYEIGNLESVQTMQYYNTEIEQLTLTGKYWLRAVVGFNLGKDRAATDGVKEWAKEKNMDAYEVQLDNGPSIEEMLVQVIREARLLPSMEGKQKELLEEFELASQARYNPKAAKKLKERREKEAKQAMKNAWHKTDKGWVAPASSSSSTTQIATTASSSSRGCIVM